MSVRGVVQIFNLRLPKSLKITDLVPGLMSKKRDKNTKDGKDKKDNTHKKNNKHGKHCKSKKADGQKRKRPAGYSKEYEARRKDEGHIAKLKIKALVTLLYGIYSPVTASEKRMIAYMVCLADREFRCHSYRQHVSYLQTCPGSLHMYTVKEKSVIKTQNFSTI